MQRFALRERTALAEWGAETVHVEGPETALHERSTKRRRPLTAAMRVALQAASFSLFHDAFLDEVAIAALALVTLQVRQREVGIFAGLPLMPSLEREAPVCRHEIAQATAVADRGAAADAKLVALGDKRLLWSDDRESYLMYARQGGKLVALFDPVGPSGNWDELARKFRTLARRRSCIPVFYQVSEPFLAATGMQGMRGYKLGELAEIALPAFSMAGGEWASLRRAINRAGRDGLVYEFIDSSGVPAVLDEIRNVSNAWLVHGGTREKRFSLGAFREDYVASSPVAVARMDGKIVAFASVLTTQRGAAFVDLMRFLPGVHRGAMDFLIVRLIEDLKAKGFSTLNLGMAPLCGLRSGAGTSLWERLGAVVARHGNRFYGFQGLHSFKEKFAPDWTPRYLAVPSGIAPYLPAAATATLIAGGLSGIFRR